MNWAREKSGNIPGAMARNGHNFEVNDDLITVVGTWNS